MAETKKERKWPIVLSKKEFVFYRRSKKDGIYY